MHRRLTRLLITLATVALAACDSATAPLGYLHFSGAANAVDTAGSRLLPLVVEVRDAGGAPVPAGTTVLFKAVVEGIGAFVHIALPTRSTSSPGEWVEVTDGAGRVSVLVLLGGTAGPAPLSVSVPALGIEGRVVFTITPGNPARVNVSPADTAILAGKSFTPHAGNFDQWGNLLREPLTWTVSGPGVTVSDAWLVSATTIGRYRLIAKGVGGADTSWVSVVPPGRLVGYSGFNGPATIRTFDVDGSNPITVASATSTWGSVDAVWIPGTTTVAYVTVVDSIQTLFTVGADGEPRPFFASRPPNVTHMGQPAPSADGKWLYFAAVDSRCSSLAFCVSRARIDGSAPELLVNTFSTDPSPSPDGSKVAYAARGTIRVLDVTTRMTSSWSVLGTEPAWSPDGTQIAYRTAGGVVALIRPDGTSQRTLPSTAGMGSISSWSPDSKWLIGKTVLIDAAAGTVMPLPYTYGGNYVATSMR